MSDAVPYCFCKRLLLCPTVRCANAELCPQGGWIHVACKDMAGQAMPLGLPSFACSAACAQQVIERQTRALELSKQSFAYYSSVPVLARAAAAAPIASLYGPAPAQKPKHKYGPLSPQDYAVFRSKCIEDMLETTRVFVGDNGFFDKSMRYKSALWDATNTIVLERRLITWLIQHGPQTLKQLEPCATYTKRPTIKDQVRPPYDMDAVIFVVHQGVRRGSMEVRVPRDAATWKEVDADSVVVWLLPPRES